MILGVTNLANPITCLNIAESVAKLVPVFGDVLGGRVWNPAEDCPSRRSEYSRHHNSHLILLARPLEVRATNVGRSLSTQLL